MNVFNLFNNRLDPNSQNMIRVFLMGYGTKESNLLKDLFSKINKIKEEYQMHAGIDDFTAWRYKIMCHPTKELNFLFETWKCFIAYNDLEIAFLQSPVCECDLFDIDPCVTNVEISHIQDHSKILFHKQYGILTTQNKDFQTPTAKIIDKLTERHFTQANRTFGLDVNTLWSIRIFNRLGRLNVPHKELQMVYNSIVQYKNRL